MADLRTIQIDLDIHKLIEGERRSFGEPSHLAWRFLLRLPEPPVAPKRAEKPTQRSGMVGRWSHAAARNAGPNAI